MMGPGTRRVALVAHVGCSVGWLGAVLTSVVLGVTGLLGRDPALVRGVYLILDVIGWWVLVPFSVASLLTGLVQSLGSSWGLLRHYWVIAKLVMNLFATTVLLMYTQTLDALAAMARTASTHDDLERLRDPSPVAHASAAVALLLVALVLSIYKPRGVTGYGQRKQRQPRTPAARRAERATVAR